MEPIRSFDQLTSHLKSLNKRKRIAVVCANDPNTEYAIADRKSTRLNSSHKTESRMPSSA